MSNTDPDDDMDETHARLVEMLFGVLADEGRDTDEGGAAMTVPAPHKPSPHDSAIALALPVEDEDE